MWHLHYIKRLSLKKQKESGIDLILFKTQSREAG
jgi:hypothetical protein